MLGEAQGEYPTSMKTGCLDFFFVEPNFFLFVISLLGIGPY